ncbi:hypothetical protein [Paraburkholderia sp.]|jgi:hypothetical protein|nr:hypothetical protein [Paraburkholderia sp.]
MDLAGITDEFGQPGRAAGVAASAAALAGAFSGNAYGACGGSARTATHGK